MALVTRLMYTSKLGTEGPQHTHAPDHSALAAGDVSINPNASCIVMTTEILRSMIYRCLPALKSCLAGCTPLALSTLSLLAPASLCAPAGQPLRRALRRPPA